MAQPYVSGPVHMYVGTSAAPPNNPFAGGGPVYLGTCESAPRIRLNPQFEPLMNDIGGSRLPYDYLYEDMDGMVFGDLTVWNYPVLSQLLSRPNWLKAAPGVGAFGDIGSLMATEGFTYNLWLQFPFFAKAAMAGAGLPAGYHFLSAFLFGPDEIDPGTKANKIHVQFQCMRALNTASGLFSLYDFNFAGVPAVPPASPLGV